MFRRIHVWFLRKFGRLEEIYEFLEKTGGKYLDVRSYARIEGISETTAKKQLEEAVQKGIFERVFLYDSPEAPFPLIVTESEIGRSIRFSDYGDVSDDDSEIEISKYDVREIYVTTQATG